MSDDAILEALSGLSSGFVKGWLPFAEKNYDNRLLMQRKAEDVNTERENKISDRTADQSIWEKRLGMQEESDIRKEKAKPRTTYVQQSDGSFIPVDGKVAFPRAPQKPPALPNQKAIDKATEQLAEARSIANTQIPQIDELIALNKDSSGGVLGGLKQKAMSAMNLDSKTYRNTETVVNSLKSLVSKVLKSTFGGQLSDSEREYLNSVYGAAESYSVAQREIAMNNVKKMFTNKISESELKMKDLTGSNSVAQTDINAGTPSFTSQPSSIALQGNKAKRLQELRMKAQQGTIGK